jgi:hypothetical protein
VQVLGNLLADDDPVTFAHTAISFELNVHLAAFDYRAGRDRSDDSGGRSTDGSGFGSSDGDARLIVSREEKTAASYDYFAAFDACTGNQTFDHGLGH